MKNNFSKKMSVLNFVMAIISMTVVFVGNMSVVFADNKLSVDLPLPPVSSSERASYEPIPYQSSVPGEYKDVDLPDHQKPANSSKLYLADASSVNTQASHGRHQPPYSIQVGMFKKRDNALRLKHKLEKNHFRVSLSEKLNNKGSKRFYVRIGQYQTRQQAEEALRLYSQRSGDRAYVTDQ